MFSVSEAASNGTAVGAVSFSDADLPGDNFVVTIAAGNIDGVFAIDNAGNLTVADNAQLDFESTNTYPLTINVFDGTNSTNKPITINVLNVIETKFFVVDDGSMNRTYEYEAPGSAIENYVLNGANSAPRGAASTIAGDRVWVIDNNRKVYIYNTSGGLLGSWTAGSMASNATPQGIATNGIDVWIVDDRSDKVFKYSGAASRLSGSQSAGSSFNLNSSNGSPRDIVTDGSSLWVVNDASTNKVFKYTVAGGLLGSWTIDSANSTPTGITIDPANVSDMWIVDSGNRPRLSICRRDDPHLRQPIRGNVVRIGGGEHQPARNCRSTVAELHLARLASLRPSRIETSHFFHSFSRRHCFSNDCGRTEARQKEVQLCRP